MCYMKVIKKHKHTIHFDKKAPGTILPTVILTTTLKKVHPIVTYQLLF